jgi:FkbM family methyltransferase
MNKMMQAFYKVIYNPEINKVLRNINKPLQAILPGKIKIPPSGILSIQNSGGKKLKIKTNQTNYLTHLIFWEGYQNFEYTDIFIDLIRKVNVFYDIGANIGYYSLLAEMENSDIKVVGFEPAKGPLFFFRENVRINNFQKIKIEEIALSEKEGEITFYEIKNKKYSYLEHNLAGESNAGSKTTDRNFVKTQVKTTTLDKYIIENKEEMIDLIKMDTEGTEHLILENASIVLEKMKPIFICETLFNKIESKLETIFLKYGYEFYNHTEDGLKKVESIKRTTDNGVRNCFFVHPSKFHLIEEYVR